MPDDAASQRKAWRLLLTAVLCVLAAEAVLQIRSQLLTGQSVWNL
jgi:hypothetical protein